MVNIVVEPRLPPNNALTEWCAKMATWVHCVGADRLRQWCPVLADELSVRVEQDPRFVAWSESHGRAVAAFAPMMGVITRAVAEFARCGYGAAPPVAVEWRPVPEAYDTLMNAGMWGAASCVGDVPLLIHAPYGAVAAAMRDYPRAWALAHWVDDDHCVLSTDEAVFAYAAHVLGDASSAVQMLGHGDALVRQYAGTLYTKSVGVKRTLGPGSLAAHVPELATTAAGVLAMLYCADLPEAELETAREWAARSNLPDFALQRAAARRGVLVGQEKLTESTVLRSMALSPHVPDSIRAALQAGMSCRAMPLNFGRLGQRRLPQALVARHGAYSATTGDDWALDLLQYKRMKAGE